MMQLHPELAGQFSWGGAHGTQIGGGGPPDLMHFDIGGERGHYSQFRRKELERRFQPAPFKDGDASSPAEAHRKSVAARSATHSRMVNNNRHSETQIGQINVHTQAKDAEAIAKDIGPALRRSAFIDHADYGLA
jgi:hypothetical protein